MAEKIADIEIYGLEKSGTEFVFEFEHQSIEIRCVDEDNRKEASKLKPFLSTH